MKNLLSFLLIAACAAPAGAQQSQDSITNFAFTYRVAGTITQVAVAPQTNIIFPDTVTGKTSTITLQIVSNSQSTYMLSRPVVTGPGFSSSQYSASAPASGAGPATITLNFTPAAPGPAFGLLQFTLVSPTGVQIPVFFNLFSNGLAPQFLVSYVEPVSGNQILLNNGDTLPLPGTAVNASSSLTVDIANAGTGSGVVNSVSVTGAAFSLSSLPLLPNTLQSNATMAFQVTFKPLARQQYTGTLTVVIGGQSETFALTGQGTSSSFSYSVISGGNTTPVIPGGAITLPQVNLQSGGTNPSSSVVVKVTNTGNIDGAISTIGVTGTEFQVTGLPVLPITMHVGDTLVFSVVYTPLAIETNATGELRVGSDQFTLTGSAIGSALTVQVEEGSSTITVANKGIIPAPNTMVGDKRTVYIDISSSGGVAVSLALLSASGQGFSIPNPPALPVQLDASQTVRVPVVFAPTAIGPATGALNINDQTFVLTSVGDTPPPIPQVTFTGLGSSLAPLQQPAPGLQLASAYPYDLTGTLTLTFLSNSFVDDPSVEFANGTRTVNFTIPANTTQAVFSQLGKTALFQTGTLAGTVGLAATFAVQTADVTPKTQPSFSTQIAAGAPQVTSVRVGSQQSNVLTLLVSGYSTARSVSQLAFQFTGAPNTNVTTPSLTADVSSAFTNWYSTPTSHVFGSQFTVSVALTLTGDPTALQSIAVSASNSLGNSAPKTVTLR